HMKNVEVPTGEKSMFGLGKEIMKTEKKPTKNVVISERDYKNLVTAARDNDKLKQHVRNLMSTDMRSEEHTSELQSRFDLVCRLLLEKKKRPTNINERIL